MVTILSQFRYLCHCLLHTFFVSFWLSQLVEHVPARTKFARVSNPSQPIRVFKKELVTHYRAVLPLNVDEHITKNDVLMLVQLRCFICFHQQPTGHGYFSSLGTRFKSLKKQARVRDFTPSINQHSES